MTAARPHRLPNPDKPPSTATKYFRLTVLAFLLLLLFLPLSASPSPAAAAVRPAVHHHRRLAYFKDGAGRTAAQLMSPSSSSWSVRRVLIGPGSSPPTCRSKCGNCSPCRAVHVPIQQGMSVPLEYYPEAWRCKCGNKLFMP